MQIGEHDDPHRTARPVHRHMLDAQPPRLDEPGPDRNAEHARECDAEDP
jgi:hypothetical protein